MHMSLAQSLRWAAAIATSAAFGIGVFASTASASSKLAAGQARHEYCAVKVAPVRPHQQASRVISRTCSDRRAKGSALPLGFSAAGSYPIITLYQYTNFTGSFITFNGSHTCNGGAYALDDTQPAYNGAGSWGASSWQAHSSCYATTVYYGTHLGTPKYQYAQGTWEAGQIGSPWDNHVWSIWTGRVR